MNLLNFPGFIENLGTRIFNLTFYEPFLLLTFHFVYRYRALIGPENTEQHFRKRFVQAILIFLVYSSFAAIPAHLTSMDPVKNRHFFVNASEFTSSYLRRSDAIPLAMLYFHDPANRAHFDETTLVLLIVSGVVVTIPLAANIVLVFKIARAVGKKWAIDPRLQKLQMQLNRALMLQFFIPSIFYMIPFIVVLGMPLVGINIGYAVNFIFLAPSLYTIIDPIMLLLTVSRFRDVITGWISIQDRRAARNEKNEMERTKAYKKEVHQSQMTSSIVEMHMEAL